MVKSISFDESILEWATEAAKKAKRPLSNYINWLLFKEREKEKHAE
jgi:hypothetical protein